MLDANRVPLTGILATVGCLAGVIASVIFISSGLSTAIQELKDIHTFNTVETDFMEMLRLWFYFIAIFTIFLGLTTLFVDGAKQNARFTGVPMCQICEGTGPCVVVRIRNNIYVHINITILRV